MVVKLEDEPGLLSLILKILADFRANILTIHQAVPVNGIAALTLSMDLPQTLGDIAEIISMIERVPGVAYAKVLAEEN